MSAEVNWGHGRESTYRTLPLVVWVVEALDVEAVGRELGPSGLSLGEDLLPEVLQRGGFAGEAAGQADDGDVLHRGWLGVVVCLGAHQ